MGSKEVNCPVCGSKANEILHSDPVKYFYSCPVCGRYEFYPVFAELTDFNLNHLSSYLLYNGYRMNPRYTEYKYFSTMRKEQCEKYQKDYYEGNTEHGCPIYLSKENVENWYPKTLAEKIDYILLHLNSRSSYMGEEIRLNKEEALSCFFIERYNSLTGKEREQGDLIKQFTYMFDYLVRQEYIKNKEDNPGTSILYNNPFVLEPNGYARIDMLQKNNSENSKTAFVAMQFGGQTQKLRESIRKGIENAGYIAVLIDEVQHNELITPEILKHIRESKFVVADLTHQNNGAYLEEGYAMGLGKPVIQLCQEGVKLHFDIAQKNTIIWENEDDIVERLEQRIRATVD